MQLLCVSFTVKRMFLTCRNFGASIYREKSLLKMTSDTICDPLLFFHNENLRYQGEIVTYIFICIRTISDIEQENKLICAVCDFKQLLQFYVW